MAAFVLPVVRTNKFHCLANICRSTLSVPKECVRVSHARTPDTKTQLGGKNEKQTNGVVDGLNLYEINWLKAD